MALDSLDFSVPGADRSVSDAVRGASLLLGLDDAAKALPDEVLAAAKGEYARLVGALYAQGFYAPVVSVKLDGREAADIAPLDPPGTIRHVVVEVRPGPQYRFSEANLSPVAPGTTLPKGFAKGAVAESGVIKQAVSAGIDGWRDLGHAKAKVAGQDIVADHRASALAARVTLAPGPKLRFGNVTIEGEQRTRENRVRKIAGLPVGKVFSPAEVKRAADRLRRTGTFKSVSITEDDGIAPPDGQNMTVSVVEEKLRRISFGAEVSSLDGVDVTTSFLHRNLFKGAERFEAKANAGNIGSPDSGVDYGLALTLDRPATLSPDTTLRFGLGFQHLDEADYRENVFGANIGFTQTVSEQLTARIDIQYQYAKGTAFSSTGVSDPFLFRSLALPLGVTWDRRDSKTDATKGFYIDAEAKPYLGFGTTGTGVRLTTDLRGYRGFGEDNKVVLAARMQLGAVFGSGLLDTAPSDLFYSGGGGTVRGQPYQSLGASVLRKGAAFEVGGTHFLGASAEIRTKITDKIGVVGFVDAGRVDVGGFFKSGDWHAGAGLGLRYATGFGPIRLDVAVPVGGSTGKGGQVYVGLGQAF
jgi:translocation and assembly module TamA